MLQVISTILVIGLGTPIFFAVVIPIGVLYYWIQVSILSLQFMQKFIDTILFISIIERLCSYLKTT